MAVLFYINQKKKKNLLKEKKKRRNFKISAYVFRLLNIFSFFKKIKKKILKKKPCQYCDTEKGKKGLTILPKNTCVTENGEGERDREIKNCTL